MFQKGFLLVFLDFLFQLDFQAQVQLLEEPLDKCLIAGKADICSLNILWEIALIFDKKSHLKIDINNIKFFYCVKI